MVFNRLMQGRRQGVCLWGAKLPKGLATAARAIKFCASPEKKKKKKEEEKRKEKENKRRTKKRRAATGLMYFIMILYIV